MPVYTIRDPRSGKIVKLTGDSPPSEAELSQIFAQLELNDPARKPASAEDFTEDAGPEGSAAGRFGSSVARNALPSTTPSDYVTGPLYAIRHPLDAIGLLLSAAKDAHAEQASKTAESARGILSEPTIGGKAAAVSQTLGHGLATVLPLVGPAAAAAGEQGAKGDIAGMLGSLTGLIGGGVLAPEVARGATKAAGPVRAGVAGRVKAAAGAQMEKALNPTRIDTKVKAARVVPGMLDRRIWNKDLKTLEARAAEQADVAGQAVDRELSLDAEKTSDVQPLVQKLEQAKDEYVGVTRHGDKVINNPGAVKQIDKLQSTLNEYGDKITVESMVKLRRNWDQVVNAARGFVQPDLKTNYKAWAAREGRSALRDALTEAVPSIDKINAEYAFWQNIEDVANATNQRRVGQARNLTSTIAGAAGAAAAESVLPGSGVAAAATGVAGFKFASALKKLVESPGYQMWSAVQKARLADALMSRNPRTIELAISNGLRSVAVKPRPSGASAPIAPSMADREEDENGQLVVRR